MLFVAVIWGVGPADSGADGERDRGIDIMIYTIPRLGICHLKG